MVFSIKQETNKPRKLKPKKENLLIYCLHTHESFLTKETKYLIEGNKSYLYLQTFPLYTKQ